MLCVCGTFATILTITSSLVETVLSGVFINVPQLKNTEVGPEPLTEEAFAPFARAEVT